MKPLSRALLPLVAVLAFSPAKAPAEIESDPLHFFVGVTESIGTLKVANRFDLERALWGYKAGDKVEFSVLRQGKQVKTKLTLSGPTEVVSSSRGRCS